MNPSRLDRMPEDALAQKLAEMRTSLDELKQPQQFGSSDVRIYRLFNDSGQPDIVLPGLSTTPRCVEVTLKPRSGVLNPATALDFGVTFNYAGTQFITFSVQPIAPVAGVQKWRIYCALQSGTLDVSLYFTFWSIAPGSYSAIEIPV